jgi:hypothetical protein
MPAAMQALLQSQRVLLAPAPSTAELAWDAYGLPAAALGFVSSLSTLARTALEDAVKLLKRCLLDDELVSMGLLGAYPSIHAPPSSRDARLVMDAQALRHLDILQNGVDGQGAWVGRGNVKYVHLTLRRAGGWRASDGLLAGVFGPHAVRVWRAHAPRLGLPPARARAGHCGAPGARRPGAGGTDSAGAGGAGRGAGAAADAGRDVREGAAVGAAAEPRPGARAVPDARHRLGQEGSAPRRAGRGVRRRGVWQG